MKKEVTAVFTLTSDEIREALYSAFVSKFKANNISAVFSPEEVDIKVEDSYLDVILIITEEKEI